MNLYSLPPFLSIIINLILGIFVFSINKRLPANRLFLFLSLCCALWNLSAFMLFLNLPENFAFQWAKILFVAVIWIPPIFLNLVFILLAIRKKFFFPIIYSVTAILSILTLTSLIFKGISQISYTPEVSAFFAQAGPLYPLFITFMVCIVFYAIWQLFQGLKRSTGVKKAQIKYLLIGYVFATIGFNDMLPIVGILKYPLTNTYVYPFGSVAIIFWCLIIAYAIFKHHLLDIDIVIKKGAVYAYLSFLVLLPCMIIIIFAQKLFFGQSNSFFSFLTFSTLLLASLVFLKVKPEIEEYIEKKFFRRKYSYKKALSELSKIVISFLDEKELFKKAGNILTKDLGIQSISFYLLDREKRAYTLRASQNLNKPHPREFPRTDPFFLWLQEKRKTIVKEVLERSMDDPYIKPIVVKLDSMQSEVCIPLMTRDELIGIINLGYKRSGEMYSHEDLDLLTHFATQASVALENARLYQDMQQTHMLMRRTDRLASLGSLTAGLAHEIRNPLSTIKTFLDLFPQRYREKEFRGDFLKLTSSELDRITTLVSDLLDFARPTKPNVKKRDVNEVLEEVIHLVTVEAVKQDITIDTNLQEIPQATLDEDQMKQVFLNLFLNSIEAISNHGKISVTSRSIQKEGVEYVQVEIVDTGKGIPKKILDSIFDPFVTTKKQGIGLGLSISHQIVQEHHGTITVESRAKKGTTFFVNIPCKT